LEEAAADVSEQTQPEVVSQIDESDVNQITFLAVIYAHLEQISEIAERILIH